MTRLLSLALAVLLACAGCVVPLAVPPAPPADAAPVVAGHHAEVAAALTAELNRQRRAQGLQVLRTDPALERAAAEYAQELAARRRLDHHSPTPGRHTHTQRIDMAGGRWQRAAENLARVPDEAGQVTPRVISLWLGSNGHRRNLLDPDFTHTGAGAFRDLRGEWWVVQLYTLQPPRR